MSGVCRSVVLVVAGVALVSGWTTHTTRPPVRVPILLFHRVGSEPPGPYITDALTVPTAVFAAEMEWLHRDGFHAITLARLWAAIAHGRRLPSKPVVITFDDGYRDVLWNAAPTLARLHMPAADFVVTGRVSGRDSSFLTWPEVHQLEGHGFTIGSHTVHHLELTHLPIDQAAHELVASRRALQRELHRPIRYFAYPAGRFDARVVARVRRAGYRLAFTTLAGDVQTNPLLLHRDEILDTTGVRGLAALVGSSP